MTVRIVEVRNIRIDIYEVTCTRMVHSNHRTGEPLFEEMFDGTIDDRDIKHLQKGHRLERTPIARRVYK